MNIVTKKTTVCVLFREAVKGSIGGNIAVYRENDLQYTCE